MEEQTPANGVLGAETPASGQSVHKVSPKQEKEAWKD